MTDSADQRPSVLWIGESQHIDFQDAYEWLSNNAAVHAVPSPDDASLSATQSADKPNTVHSGDGGNYKVVALAQSYPTQFSQAAVQQLTQRWPLTQFAVILGSWCEGEMRTGFPWPGIQRIYWHRWRSQLTALVGRGQSSDKTGFVSPLSRLHNQADRDLHALESPLPEIEACVGVATKCRLTYEAIADVCKLAGIEPHWYADPPASSNQVASDQISSKSRPDVIVYDADDTDDRQWNRLTNFAAGELPVIAVLGFPRRQDYDAAKAAGASAIISKPFDVQDLLTAIASTLQHS